MHLERERIVLGGACALALGLLVSLVPLMAAAQAAPPARMRVVLRVASDEDRALLPRVRGQLSDVACDLVTVETDALEPSFAAQVERSRALADTSDAGVVLWFAKGTRAADAVLVHVATPREDRVFTRRLHVDEQQTPSALLEAMALVVRGTVSALVAGGSIGIATRDAVRAAGDGLVSGVGEAGGTESDASVDAASGNPLTHESEHEAPRQEAAAFAPEPQPLAASSAAEQESGAPSEAWHLVAFAGGQSSVDGATRTGQHGLRGRVGVMHGALALFVVGGYGFASDISDSRVQLQVARHELAGIAGLALAPARTLRVTLGAMLGALFASRDAQVRDAAVTLTRAKTTTAAFMLGPDLIASWWPSTFGLALELGCDVLPHPPAFLLDSDTPALRMRHSLSAVQPRASLGIEVHTP